MKRKAHGEPVKGLQTALRRLAAQAGRDLERFEEDPESRLHSLRKTMKRYRSLLGLTRGATDGAERRELMELAQKLKNGMSGSRDALVARRTIADILGPEAPPRLKFPAGAPCPAAASFQGIAKELAGRTRRLDLSKLDRSALEKGWKRTKRRLRHARRSAAKRGDAKSFHLWRKRAKDAWYQAALLKNVFKSARRLCKPVESLSEVLGREHDVTVALDTVAGLERSEREAFEKRRRALRDDALSRNP